MLVNVTEKHIACGVRSDCCDCPISLAQKDALEAAGLNVNWIRSDAHSTDITLRIGGKSIDYEVVNPPSVGEFMEAFDNDQPVAPFSFEWEVPIGP